MGALTSTRKRNDEVISLRSGNPHNSSWPDFLSSKRLRLSSMNQVKDQPLTSKGTFTRVLRYPDFTLSRPRKVHAPVKSQRFGPSTSLNRDLSQVSRASIGIESFEKEEDLAMGITLSKVAKYKKTMQEGLNSLRVLNKLKEVIDLVDNEGQKEIDSEDLSIKEIHALPFSSAANPQESIVSELSNGNAVSVEGKGNMLSLVSVESDDDIEVLSKSAFKKLLHETNKRDTKLAQITSDIKLYEDRLSLQQMRPTKKAEVFAYVSMVLLR